MTSIVVVGSVDLGPKRSDSPRDYNAGEVQRR
jgi:hypothetical protein